MIDQTEAKRLLNATDLLAERLSEREKKFIASMLDDWQGDFTPKQKMYIESIADRNGIL